MSPIEESIFLTGENSHIALNISGMKQIIFVDLLINQVKKTKQLLFHEVIRCERILAIRRIVLELIEAILFLETTILDSHSIEIEPVLFLLLQAQKQHREEPKQSFQIGFFLQGKS